MLGMGQRLKQMESSWWRPAGVISPLRRGSTWQGAVLNAYLPKGLHRKILSPKRPRLAESELRERKPEKPNEKPKWVGKRQKSPATIHRETVSNRSLRQHFRNNNPKHQFEPIAQIHAYSASVMSKPKIPLIVALQ